LADIDFEAAPVDIAPAAAPLSLRRNVSWAFLGNVLFAACNFVILQLLVRLGTPELVGQFVLGMSIATPLLLLTDLSLRSVQITDARRETPFGYYLGMRLLTTLLAMLVLGGCVLVGDYSVNVVVVLLSIGLAKGLESISDILHGAMQQNERLDWVSHSLILRGVLSVLVVGAAFVATGSLAWTMAALVLTRIAILFGYDLSSAAACLGSVPGESRFAQVLPRIDRKVIARLFWLSWPVGLTVTVLSLNTYVPRFFLAETHGDAALGIFGAFAYVIIVGQMVVAAIGAAASPRLAKHYDDGDLTAFFDLTWRMAALCGAAGLAIVVVSLAMGKQVVAWLYGPVYAVHADVFTWMMVAAGVGYVSAVFGYVVTSTRRFHSLTIPYALGAVFAAALSIWLVPAYGIQGAAWVMLGVSLSNLAIGLILVLQAVREKRSETASSTPARDMGS